jgi:hypothetical protein
VAFFYNTHDVSVPVEANSNIHDVSVSVEANSYFFFMFTACTFRFYP